MTKISLTLLCFMFTVCVYAQDEPCLKLVGLEAGADLVLTEVIRYDNIRGETTWYGDAAKNVRGFGSRFYGGLRAEVRSRNNKFAFSGGLRYTRLVTLMTKGNDHYIGNASDFFYFRVGQSENSIEYLKVHELNERSDYLGIPLAVNWAPFGERLFTFYFKAGLEVNYRLRTTTTVDFVNPEMKPFSEEVVDELREPGRMNAVFNTGGGFRLRAGSRLTISLEAGPSVFLTENNSRLVNTLGSFGGLFQVQLGL